MADAVRNPRVLVAGIGNVLRGDDGFGAAVIDQLKSTLAHPTVTLVETGIAGVGLVHHLMDGYDALIIVDAVERGAEPGRVFVLEPDLSRLAHDSTSPIDLHQTDAGGVIRMAAALGHVPARVWIVGCQPVDCDELGAALSEPVARAIPVVAAHVRDLVAAIVTAATGDSHAAR